VTRLTGSMPICSSPVTDDRANAAHCRAIAERHARTFALASRFLPDPQRRMAFAVYAFCRVADDAVDAGIETGSHASGSLHGIALSPADRAERLRAHRARLDAMLAGRPDGPIFRELHRAVVTRGVPFAPLYELIDGVAADLTPARFGSWAELARYCEGVASSVGELCVHLFGVQGGADVVARAVPYARTLGVAMQLTNILRDVGEDARNGRCYLPEDDLAAHGLSRERVLGDPAIAQDERWAPFMAMQIGRARALYEAARPGIALLTPDTQRCALACALGYAGILGAIERIRYDVVAQRAAPGSAERAAVLWQVWRTGPVIAPPALTPRAACAVIGAPAAAPAWTNTERIHA